MKQYDKRQKDGCNVALAHIYKENSHASTIGEYYLNGIHVNLVSEAGGQATCVSKRMLNA